MLGLEQEAGIDGKDFSNVLLNPNETVRNSIYTSYENKQRAVRDTRWKLIRYPQLHHTQLFDLDFDPYELNNLAYEQGFESKVQEMMSLLQNWQKETGDTLSLTAIEKQSMEFDYLNAESLRKPDRHQPEYILKKYFKEK
jgi:arylsulfatase A-like enzyme